MGHLIVTWKDYRPAKGSFFQKMTPWSFRGFKIKFVKVRRCLGFVLWKNIPPPSKTKSPIVQIWPKILVQNNNSGQFQLPKNGHLTVRYLDRVSWFVRCNRKKNSICHLGYDVIFKSDVMLSTESLIFNSSTIYVTNNLVVFHCSANFEF